MQILIELGGGQNIKLDLHGKSGVVESNLRQPLSDDDDDDEDQLDAAMTCWEFNARIDGLESLLLALACEGVKVDTPEVRTAIISALDAINNMAD